MCALVSVLACLLRIFLSFLSLSLLLCVLGYWFLKFSLYILFLLIHGSVFFFFSFSRFVCLFVFSFAFCLFVQLVVLYLHRAMIKFDRTDLAWKWSSSLISLECPRRVSLPRRRLCNFRASSSSPLPPTVSSPLLFPS